MTKKKKGGNKGGQDAPKAEAQSTEPKQETTAPKEAPKEVPKETAPAKETPKAEPQTTLGTPGTQLGGSATQSQNSKKKNKKKGGEEKKEPKETEGEGTQPGQQPFKFDFGAKPTGAQQPFAFDFGGPKGGQKSKKKKADQMVEEEDEEGEEQEMGSFFQDPKLLKALQKQMNTLIGKSSGYLESLPPAVQDRIKALKALQDQKANIDKDFKRELEELEKKYDVLFQPLYNKRADIVNGRVEPSSDEIGQRVTELDSEGKEVQTKKQGSDISGVPEFWLTALKHHPEFSEIVTQKDEDALKYLIDIKTSSLESSPGFALQFFFNPNPYFEETQLDKIYHLVEDASGTQIYDRVEPFKITWKAGKNLTIKKVTKKSNPKRGRGRGGKGGAKPTTITTEEPCDSFFNFFDPEATIEHLQNQEDFDEEEDPLEVVEAILEQDYDLGLELREKIIPNAVLWFTGEAEDDAEGYDDFEGEEGEEGEDDEYNSEHDEDYAPNPNDKPPNCNQQ